MQDEIEDNEDFTKFETCKYRSSSKTSKKGCCSSNILEGYSCLLKKIFPLSPIRHCLKCNSFEKED
jgi:hypothetical protein